MEEGCSVCWRSFSTQLIPLTLICGHSFCGDCSENLKKCPLCRRRLSVGYQRVTNYSLLSLVDRIGQENMKEKKDFEMQTDNVVTVRRRVREDQSSNLPKKKPLVVKVGQIGQGLFKSLELKFK